MDTWALRACEWLLLAFCHISSTSAICENSSEYNRTVFIPINGTATFFCNVTGLEALLYLEHRSVWWSAKSGGFEIVGIHPQLVDPYNVINVTVSGNDAILNRTSILCFCYEERELPFLTYKTTIFIYDPPSPPTNLTVTEIVGTSVNISWRAPFTPSGVALWYHVMIADLNSTQIPTPYQSNTTHYEMSRLNCYQCTITVVAVNEAGESDSVMFNLTNVRPQTPSPSPSEEPTSQTLTTQSTTLVPPLLVCVIVAPVGGFVIVVLIVIAFVAAVRCRRTRRLKIPAPKIAAVTAGQTATPRDPRDTRALLNAYRTPHA